MTQTCSPNISGSNTIITRQSLRLLDEAVAIEQADARAAGKIGYMSRAMIQASMPYRDPKTTYFSRKNGNFRLEMLAPPTIGLPFGNIPRLILCWLSTEVVRTKERTLVLGHNLTDFMKQIGLDTVRGGKTGSITRLKDQSNRLFSCLISYRQEADGYTATKNLVVADQFQFWWHTQNPSALEGWKSQITLSETFYEDLLNSPVPLDLRAIMALKTHPLALDIYCWLVYRLGYLRKIQPVPWGALQMQFGADFERTRDFKRGFIAALSKVLIVYPAAKIDLTKSGLRLRPSKLHIAR